VAVGADGGSEGDGRKGSGARRDNHFGDCAGSKDRSVQCFEEPGLEVEDLMVIVKGANSMIYTWDAGFQGTTTIPPSYIGSTFAFCGDGTAAGQQTGSARHRSGLFLMFLLCSVPQRGIDEEVSCMLRVLPAWARRSLPNPCITEHAQWE
jgi:hypothetical protein